MQIIKIVVAGLKANGLSGLVIPGTCGCVIDDLSPANCLCDDCEGGYKYTHSNRKDWIISTKKEPQLTDEEIESVIAECG